MVTGTPAFRPGDVRTRTPGLILMVCVWPGLISILARPFDDAFGIGQLGAASELQVDVALVTPQRGAPHAFRLERVAGLRPFDRLVDPRQRFFDQLA